MEFDPDKLKDFHQVFEQAKNKIAAFEGCHHLELCRDASQANVLYTFSHWTDQEALERYRHSELFKTTWSQTKVLFAGKPQAFSLLSH